MPTIRKINVKPAAKPSIVTSGVADTPTPADAAATSTAVATPAATTLRASLRAKRTGAKPGKPAVVKPGKAAKAEKPAADVKPAAPTKHEPTKLTYAGPSPVVRGHGRKLTPINPGKSFGDPTDRDDSFLRDMRATYAGRIFLRLDCDAGCVNRQLYYGNLAIVDGDLSSRSLRLQITARGLARKL